MSTEGRGAIHITEIKQGQHTECSECEAPLGPGRTVFVRENETHIYCSVVCATSGDEVIKPTTEDDE